MARVVVTGGFGFVGSHVVEHLLRQGDEVTVFDLAAAPPELAATPGLRHIRGDVRDTAAVAAAVAKGTDIVYHLAAVVGVDQYLARPLDVIEVNVDGTRNALRAALSAGARVVMSSTSEVYGRNPRTPWREDDDRVLGSTATDRWSYSSSKAAAEHLTFAYHRQEGLPVTILRYFNVYGPRQRPAYVVSRTVSRLLRGEVPIVYDDGTQTRCFTYVADAAAATLLAASHPAAGGECFNIGSERETTMAEAIRLATSIAGAGAPAATVDTADALGRRYQDIPRRVPDCGKAAALLGWRATTSLQEGLRRTFEWARRNPWWCAQPDEGIRAG
jgi:nucleoside-diphosphate-sugar epimerase